MKISELTEKYHTTLEQIRKEQYNFLQSEGFLANGHECMTFMEWLDNVFSFANDTPEPFQKGDMNINNLS